MGADHGKQQSHDLIPAWVNPDWDRLLEVIKTAEGSFRSGTISKVDLPAGALFARLTGLTASPQNYLTVQTGRDSHILLNSNAQFCNHSCDPTLEFDMVKFEVRVRRDRALKKGEALTFFYPSTEWTMAQPFDCWCGAGEGKCLERIDGAGSMDEAILKRYWLNGYIEELLVERKEGKTTNGGEWGNGTNGTLANH